jgi:outer membrane protein assembly factor BamB
MQVKLGRRKHRPSALGPALVAAVVVGASMGAARADDWGTPGLDISHSRLSAERSGASFGSGRWSTSFKTGGAVLASPVVADGFLVTVDLDGAVSALRAEDGTPVWQVAAGSAVHGTPAVEHGRVFVPTFANKVVALRLGDGLPLWTKDVGGTVLSSPTPVDGDIIVAAGFPQRHVVRLSGSTGEVVWQSPDVMQQFSNTSPVVGGGVVVVGSNGGRYYAFNLATGAALWEYVGDGLVHLAAPIIVGGRVFMAGGYDSSHVHAVDAATGAPIAGWPIDLPTPDPDVTGTIKGRQRAISSFAAVAGMLLLQTRLDDALDVDGDGVIDERLSREMVVAIDPATGALAWQVPRGRAVVTDPNDVPKFLVCPTPAAYGTDGGSPLVAAASSLDSTIVILDPATGNEQARLPVAGPTLASPLLANGRLLSVAVNGTIEGLSSRVNVAPGAPIPAGAASPVDVVDLTLRWLPAIDPDGEIPSYELRIDADGEVLESWQQQIFLPPGTTSTQISGAFVPGTIYTFALRARDPHGALSSWSAPQTFTVFKNPPVTVGGMSAKSLADALGNAQPGDVIMLGAGTFTLTDTLHVGGGVSIQGAGAGKTTLSAAGLGVGVKFEGTAAGHQAGLDGVTVTGAGTCIQVSDGSTGVRLSHVVVRDCGTDGVAVAATGGAEIVNATMLGSGTGVHATGTTTIKNSLLTANGVALAADVAGVLTSSYDALFGNGTAYKGLTAGTGDSSAAVTFADLAGRDLRLLVTQPSTDKGDPADAVGAEPAPNGARINLGAFGGTADAEPSAPSTAVGGTGNGPAPGQTDPPGGTPPAGTGGDGGCSVSGRPEIDLYASVLLAGLALVVVLARRRPALARARRRPRR